MAKHGYCKKITEFVMVYAILQKNGRKLNTPKIAVHMHLFYVEQLADLLHRLQNLAAYPYDLFVTIVKENATVKQKILAFKPDARIWVVPNYGYDVGPFIDFLHKIDLDAYDYIIKIHTKRIASGSYCIFNNRRFNMKMWREMLLEALLGSPQNTGKNLGLLAQNPQIGMLGSSYLYTDEDWTYRNIEHEVQDQMAKIGLAMPSDKHFIAGTMFWVRAKLLKPFLAYQIADFATSDINIHDATLAHVIERMFGLAVSTQGYQIRGVHYKNYVWHFVKARFRRFIFQKKITRSGALIIKICKIPVYHHKGKI